VMDNYSPHLSTKVDTRVGDWAQANNVEIAYVSFYGSWLNRIEPQFTALRYFALDGTDHSSHHEQASMIRRYIAWRNSHLTDPSYAKSSAEPAPSNGQRLPDAVLARPQRRPVLHLPAHWPWPTKWLAIWNGVFATRTGARTPDSRLRPSTAEQARPEEPLKRPGFDGGFGLVRRLGLVDVGFIVSGLEELVDGDGFVAAGAESAGSEAAHEAGAVLASLFAEQLGLALGALVDGVGSAGAAGGQLGGGRGGVLVASAPGGLATRVGAPLAGCVAGGQWAVACPAACRNGGVTRRASHATSSWSSRQFASHSSGGT
jgi:hypothetical protein